MENLTKQEQDFVKEVAITGNQTQSVAKAYKIKKDGYARVKGHRLITKDNINTAIKKVKQTLAERIDIDKLEKVYNEGLEATKISSIKKLTFDGIEDIKEPDYAVRHKYFDSGVKIIGGYAPDKNININMNITSESREKSKELIKKYLK